MPDSELWQAVADHYHASLLKSKLETRSLQKLHLFDPSLIRHFKLGYADGSLLSKLSATQKRQLKDFNSLDGQIIVPCLDLNGEAVAFASLTEPQTIIGSVSVFNAPAIPVYRDSIIVTDSIPDALRLWHPKYGNCQNVIAALDAGRLPESWWRF